MINEVDKEATGFLTFPNFLYMMAKKESDEEAEDEIRELRSRQVEHQHLLVRLTSIMMLILMVTLNLII